MSESQVKDGRPELVREHRLKPPTCRMSCKPGKARRRRDSAGIVPKLKGLRYMQEEIRCGDCRRKLGEGTYIRLSIKCPKCGAINQLSATSAPSERRSSVITQGKTHGRYQGTSTRSS